MQGHTGLGGRAYSGLQHPIGPNRPQPRVFSLCAPVYFHRLTFPQRSAASFLCLLVLFCLLQCWMNPGSHTCWASFIYYPYSSDLMRLGCIILRRTVQKKVAPIAKGETTWTLQVTQETETFVKIQRPPMWGGTEDLGLAWIPVPSLTSSVPGPEQLSFLTPLKGCLNVTVPPGPFLLSFHRAASTADSLGHWSFFCISVFPLVKGTTMGPRQVPEGCALEFQHKHP